VAAAADAAAGAGRGDGDELVAGELERGLGAQPAAAVRAGRGGAAAAGAGAVATGRRAHDAHRGVDGGRRGGGQRAGREDREPAAGPDLLPDVGGGLADEGVAILSIPMPRVSAFYGITIWFYRPDHPPPHFHAQYGEHEVRIELETLRVISGSLPRRALALVRTWARLHGDE